MGKKKDDLAHRLGTKVKSIGGELKQSNGNKGIKQSDILWYLVHKMDNAYTAIGDLKADINDKFVTKEHCKEFHLNVKKNNDNNIKAKIFTTSNITSVVSMIIALCAVLIAARVVIPGV